MVNRMNGNQEELGKKEEKKEENRKQWEVQSKPLL